MNVHARLTAIAMGWLLVAQAMADVVENDRWQQRFAVGSDARVEIGNVWGDVRVRIGAPGVVRIDAPFSYRAADEDELDKVKATYPLQHTHDSARVWVQIGFPERRWQRGWHCRRCVARYDFDVQVPPDARLEIATVNDGVVVIDAGTAPVKARNINGPVTVSGLRQCDELDSINGDVRVTFAAALAAPCRIETLNGDIDVALAAGSGADLALQQTNGRARTSLPVQPLAIKPTVRSARHNGRMRYEIEQPAGLRLGPGGPALTISTMNGDVHIFEETL